MRSPHPVRKGPGPRPTRAHRALPRVEPLESRAVPYAASGNLWPHPGLITLSFQPDGTDLGGRASNLLSTFNADFGSASAWQGAILKAAQTWAQQAAVNFTVVSDSGAASGTGSYQQGDPGYGDIRIGGFDFGDNSILAMAFMPPPVNNYSVAGDIAFNTAQVFNINGLDYDLYTVALHELGHALGLNHSTSTSAILYPVYQGVEYGLYADDIAGIQSIYGARVPDAYDAAASNNTITTASDITSQIDPTTLTAVVTGLDITTTADKDYYKFTAPAGGSGTLALTVQSTGLSLLAPSVKVYNSSQQQIALATGNGSLGSTLTLNVSVTAGQTYYIRVMGANTSAFGTGAYGMALNFGTGSSPAIPTPDTRTANGDPLSGGGGVAEHTGGSEDYDLLTIGGERSQPGPAPVFRPASVTPAPVAIAAFIRTALSAGSAAGPDATVVIVPQVRPVAAAPGAPEGVLSAATARGTDAALRWDEGSPSSPWTPPEDDAEQPAAELLLPAAESEGHSGHAPALMRNLARARAEDRGPTFDPRSSTLDAQSSVAEPSAVAAVFAVVLAPSWGGRPVATDSQRRPALAG
jgi:hypothetical protein